MYQDIDALGNNYNEILKHRKESHVKTNKVLLLNSTAFWQELPIKQEIWQCCTKSLLKSFNDCIFIFFALPSMEELSQSLNQSGKVFGFFSVLFWSKQHELLLSNIYRDLILNVWIHDTFHYQFSLAVAFTMLTKIFTMLKSLVKDYFWALVLQARLCQKNRTLQYNMHNTK